MGLGKSIKFIRREQGIPQKDLARMVGISSNAMVCIENGSSTARQGTIDAICKALHVTESYVHFCAMVKEDVKPGKFHSWNLIWPVMKDILT